MLWWQQPLIIILQAGRFLETGLMSVNAMPETITHAKRLDIDKGAMVDFEEFIDKISPLKSANKLGVILIQLPPSFTVNDFRSIERFLDRLPNTDKNNKYEQV